MASIRTIRLFVAAALITCGAVDLQARDNADQPAGSGSQSWCGTQIAYDAYLKAQGSQQRSAAGPCDVGLCDDPATRDANIPDSTDPITYIRMRIHVFRNSDGTNAISTESDVASAVAAANVDFLPSRIQFVYSMRFVNNTTYRSLAESEITAMKNAYAENPTEQLNVFITDPEFSYSFGTFPWDSRATTKEGGIVMLAPVHWWPIDNGGTFSHEIGHCLGLWHTFHGVDEVLGCGVCYEEPGAAGRDAVGDFCSDTDPTPTNSSCGDPGGNDACSGQPWGATDFRNYMGYAPDNCYTNFSPQQMGRKHCWTNSNLSGWIIEPYTTVDDTFGPAPLTVNFTGSSSKVANSWSWTFGDGGTSTQQNPSYTYTGAGLRTVSATVNTTTGNFTETMPNLIWAYGDTVSLPNLQGPPLAKIRFDISISNNLPLTKLIIPFTWAGPLSLPLDSVRTTGLRTAGSQVDTIFIDAGTRRLAVQMTPAGGTLAAGSGPVLTLWFRLPIINIPGVNPVNVQTIALFNPEHTVEVGTYAPTIINGSVKMGCCVNRTGNVNNDASDVVDIADITALVDHLFINNPALACRDEANVDGDIGVQIDIADLTSLIDFLFGSGTLPALCP